MFLESLMPLLQKGVEINLKVSLTAEGEICLDVNPVSKTNTSQVLPWKQFTASLEEFNANGGVTGVLASFVGTTKSLAQQLEDVKLVADAVAAEAANAVSKAPKVEKPRAIGSAKSVPAGLISADQVDDDDENSPAVTTSPDSSDKQPGHSRTETADQLKFEL